MFKRLICLCMALCGLLSAAVADTQQQLAWALETAEMLYETASNESYVNGHAPYIVQIIGGWAEGSAVNPDAVYRITLDMDVVADTMLASAGLQSADLPLRSQRAMTVLVNQYIVQNSINALAASSVTRTMVAYVGSCGYEFWLIDCHEGGDVIITFCPYDTGVVMVTAAFIGSEIEDEEIMETMTSFIGTGMMTIEKIR